MSEQLLRVVARPFLGDDDFWRVRELLSATVPIAPVGFNWDVRRWDGKRFYDDSGTWSPDWPARVRLWERGDGQLVAAVNPEGRGDAHLQVHPDFRHLEEQMIAWAEEHLAATTAEGVSRQLHLFAYDYDVHRQDLLGQRGYERTQHGGVIRHLRLGGQPLQPPVVAEGYRLRTTQPDDIQDCQRIADLLNAAFGRDFHTAREYQMFTRLAPSFRRELDLVVEAPDGTLAAYVGVPYDEANRRGIFEPVCTHPDHRRRGLGQALMREGLLRLRASGATDVVVETGDMVPANRLYSSIGFTEAYHGHHWRRVWR
jgi:ribosomal protein S18 acetylase RimI-like enzyme